jgi:hypothetical protein
MHVVREDHERMFGLQRIAASSFLSATGRCVGHPPVYEEDAVYGYLVQDWVTLKGSQTGVTVIQSEADWLSLQAYQDVVFWLEVKSLILAGLTSVTLDYQTAPAKDESLFVSMVTGVTLAASSVPTITKVLLGQNPTVPLARWIRWKLTPNGTVTGGQEWGVCMRIHCAANAVGVV